jgi:hypothetical protein
MISKKLNRKSLHGVSDLSRQNDSSKQTKQNQKAPGRFDSRQQQRTKQKKTIYHNSSLRTKNKKQRLTLITLKGQTHFQARKPKAVQLKETEEGKNYHPNHPVLQSFTLQLNNNPFTLNNYNTKPKFFQQAPPPPPPPNYILQAQTPYQTYHIANAGLYP